MTYDEFPHGSGMADRQDLLAVADVAFCNNMVQREKRSFNKTIDMVMGVYQREGRYNGWLAISLKPSHGGLDWLINLCFFGKVHLGYKLEFDKYWSEIFNMVLSRDEIAKKGIIISGRSKGGAEAIMLGNCFKCSNVEYPNILVGAIEPPRAFGKDAAERIKEMFPIISTCYKDDIVPALPPWYKTPGKMFQIGRRKTGRSIQDHRDSTEKEELIYKGIDDICPEADYE